MSREILVLASGSPRRRELLGGIGVPLEVVTAEVDEIEALSAGYPTPSDLARENARRKAEAVRGLRPGRRVLGADTVVALESRLFGKPASLAGPEDEMEIFHEISRVTFRELSAEIIERYLAEVHVLDKAGAYALQERGEWIIERVEGSRSNVIGLPVETLERLFRKRGWI
jgi:septum formation protein